MPIGAPKFCFFLGGGGARGLSNLGRRLKSDVCQLVSTEHFSTKTFFQDGRQKMKEFSIVSLSALYKAICKCNQINFRYINY